MGVAEGGLGISTKQRIPSPKSYVFGNMRYTVAPNHTISPAPQLLTAASAGSPLSSVLLSQIDL